LHSRRQTDWRTLVNPEVTEDAAGVRTETVAGLRQELAELRSLISSLQCQRLVDIHVPSGATVLVVSKGDESLLSLGLRRGAHFSSAADGSYLGYHPGDSLAAIAQLEAGRSKGAGFLLLPSTARWWLDYYADFALHLSRRYSLVVSNDYGQLYDLHTPRDEASGETLTFNALADSFEHLTGRAPAILDWTETGRLHTLRPDLPIFVPPDGTCTLPYLDHSVDIVAIDPGPPLVEAEAERVGVIVAKHDGDSPGETWTADWTHVRKSSGLPSCSIIIPCFNGAMMSASCLKAVNETVPRQIDCEIIVVDDASSDGTSEMLLRHLEDVAGVRVLRNESNRGFIDSCNRGAHAATGDVLVFLNNDTVPLAGWLPPLLRLFLRHADAGAVGGKLLYPDGTLQEAGGLIFRDGRGANFGRGAVDPASELFDYVRDVHYCSGALLATPRALFVELGGFDSRYRPAYYEDTDYCFAVRAVGRRVLYQPESVIIHLEGASSGTNPSAGTKRYQERNRDVFRRKWGEALSSAPDGPGRFDRDTWAGLTAIGGLR
jgi:GT2 family glycosyltransferase